MQSSGKHHKLVHTIFQGGDELRLTSAFKWLFARDVISESVPGMPLAELVGDGRVLIENHQGVSEYGEEIISVRVGYGHLRVVGENLALHCVKKHQLIICGTIRKLEIERKGREICGKQLGVR